MTEPNYKELYKRADGMIRLLSDEIDEAYSDDNLDKQEFNNVVVGKLTSFLFDYFYGSED